MTSKNTSEIERELHEDEQLLWSSSPKRGIIFRWVDLFMIPYSLLVLAGGIQAGISFLPMVSHGLDMFVLMSIISGIMPILYGLYLLMGRYLVDALQRRNISYAITNQRIIILNRFLFFRKVETIFHSDYLHVSLKEKASGVGTITFSQRRTRKGETAKLIVFGVPQERTVPTLESVPQAHEVYDVIILATKEAVAHQPRRKRPEDLVQEQKEALLAGVDDEPFRTITPWFFILIVFATLVSPILLPRLDGLRINLHLLAPVLVVLVGYLYGKKAGLIGGVIVFFPGFVLHFIGDFAFHADIKANLLAGSVKIDDLSLRTLGLSYFIYASLGYVTAVLKERLYALEKTYPFISRTKYIHVRHPGSFIPAIFLTVSIYLTGRISLQTNGLYYIMPILVAYTYGTDKAYQFLAYVSPFFLFSLFFETVSIGYRISVGQIFFFLVFLILAGNLRVEKNDDQSPSSALLFASLLAVSLLFNLTYRYEKMFFAGADFALPFFLLAGLLLGQRRGFWFGIAWGITNVIYYRFTRELSFGAPYLYLLAAPFTGYLGGTGLFDGKEFLRQGAYVVVIFNLLSLIVMFINGSNRLFLIETYYVRMIALVQGLLMVAAIGSVLLFKERKGVQKIDVPRL